MRVAVLMGGDSTERDVSLVTGDQVAKALVRNGHEVIKIDPSATKSEQTDLNETDQHWIGIDYPDYETLPVHRGTLYAKNILILKRLNPDVVFIALHGGKGENGIVQGMLDAAEISYTGSGRIASMLAMEKDLSKKFFIDASLPTPDGLCFSDGDDITKLDAFKNFPLIVKPNDQGSTIGLHVVKSTQELKSAVKEVLKYGTKIIIEAYISGREITVSILNEKPLPIVEIIPKHGLYDYECKYSDGMSRYEAPANMEDELTKKIQEISLKAHQILGCSSYSRVDLRLTENGKPFILEVNTLPGMTGTSLVPKAAKAAGMTFEELVEAILQSALLK
jgi:D-alanine-D-alanine ligase